MNKSKVIDGFSVKKAVTMPVFKMVPGVRRFFKFESEMFVGKDIKQIKDGKKMEPATLANVVNMATGEVGQLICAAVLRGNLDEAYPGTSYVGKGFAITLIRVPEKSYNLYEILEVDLPVEYQDAAPAAPVKPAKVGK